MRTRTMIIAGLIAAGAFSGIAAAQPGFDGCGPMGQSGPGMMRGGAMKGGMADPAARTEQRLSLLKSELKITPEQEPLWQAFAEKSKAEAGKGFKAMRDSAQDQNLTAPERMDRMTAMMKERLTAMESVRESFKRLYDALTPEQRKAADQHAGRMGRPARGQGPRGSGTPRR
ncbi:MAG: Spy/CpxP family protein refolding chaperone [Candidatus Nitricoxidivorans perseverans]|uniref:Spy/CpxP family protein refolding chaperone n=1 Tax=Candidatus Nitricoxidivorans perseverans TaxID=2975601 RepID=A0AA49IYF8_9PROT|nr:MAG: Spy/CpxP family protein refolding chaperone [Candidatus Nitricoxidivorans perseverans]